MSNDDFMKRWDRAGWDPIIIFTRVGLRVVGHLFFGALELAIWNWLCDVQSWRYRQLIPDLGRR